MADTNYCAISDVLARLSQDAAGLRVDDITATPASNIGDCIDEASAEIDAHIGSLYKAQFLAANRWVKFCCRSLSCEYLCIRRGQDVPSSIAADCERYREAMKLIAAGSLKLPGLPQAPGGLAVSNQSYDNNRYPALQVERPRSSPVDRGGSRKFDPNADRAQTHGG